MCLSLGYLQKSAPYSIPKISLADRQQKLNFDYRAPVWPVWKVTLNISSHCKFSWLPDFGGRLGGLAGFDALTSAVTLKADGGFG